MMETAITSVKEAGKILKKHYGNINRMNFKEGNWHEVVTKADLESNKKIIEVIRKKFPEHSIISEESDNERKKSEYSWYVDPLDGTTNYVMHNPFFCSAVALVKNSEVLLGAVYNPITDELYTAEKGKGAFLNGYKIHVSDNNDLKKTLVNFCHINNPEQIEKISTIFFQFKIKARDFRRLGSGALDFCYLACGRNDVYLRPDIVLYDILPGYIIAKEAGAKIADWDDNDWMLSSKSLLATNYLLHNAVMRLLHESRKVG